MGKIKDLDKYFFYDKKNTSIIYQHKSPMILSIPDYFKDRGYFDTNPDSGNIRFLGISYIEIDKNNTTLVFPAMLESIPSDIYEKNNMIFMVYNNDDIFLVNDYIILNTVSGIDIFKSFMILSKDISYLDYKNFITIFDNLQIILGKTLGQRVDFELLLAETTRSSKDLNTLFRNTNMDKEKPKKISMRNIAYGPKTVTSKTVGSYFNDGLVGSLTVDDDNQPTSKIEALLKT